MLNALLPLNNWTNRLNKIFVVALLGLCLAGCDAIPDGNGQGRGNDQNQVQPDLNPQTPPPPPPPVVEDIDTTGETGQIEDQNEEQQEEIEEVTGLASPMLFIANFDSDSVTSYFDPAFVNGNIAPDNNLQGAQTGFVRPSDMTVNTAQQLIVSNFGQAPSIASFENASETNGNLRPDGLVQGAATQFVQPIALAMNSSQDLLFVLDINTDEVYVFANTTQSTFNGNLAPVRTISSAEIQNPTGMAMGPNDDLYVCNNGGEVLVFANASNLNGFVTPTRIIESASFSLLWDVEVTSDNTLFVVDADGGFLFTFNNASTLNGFVAPDFTLQVPGAGFLRSIAVDSQGNGYLVDYFGDTVFSYNNVATRNGLLNPDRLIQGADTLLDGPVRVYIAE